MRSLGVYRFSAHPFGMCRLSVPSLGVYRFSAHPLVRMCRLSVRSLGIPGSLQCSLVVVQEPWSARWLLAWISAVFFGCYPGSLQYSLAVVLDPCRNV